MKLSLVIPARNEAGNILPTINGLRDCLDQEGVDFEIVVVDDGSSDSTASIVTEQNRLDPRIRLVQNLGKHGYGYAVRCGLDAFLGDSVIITMADASDSPADVIKYYHILKDHADCAFGSRWIHGGKVIDYPIVKRMINRMANLFIKLLFHFRYNDITNAFKGYRRCVIDGCKPFLAPHFNLTVEIPLKAIVRGYTYAVVPISWQNRKVGTSSLHIPEMGSRYLYTVLNIWLEKLLVPNDYHRPDNETFVP